MRAKVSRLQDNLMDAIKFAEKKEKLDEPTTLRKFLRLGAEKYVGDSYVRGEVTLGEAARILDVTTRDVLELFWDMGITGNVGAVETLRSLAFAEKKLTKKRK